MPPVQKHTGLSLSYRVRINDLGKSHQCRNPPTPRSPRSHVDGTANPPLSRRQARWTAALGPRECLIVRRATAACAYGGHWLTGWDCALCERAGVGGPGRHVGPRMPGIPWRVLPRFGCGGCPSMQGPCREARLCLNDNYPTPPLIVFIIPFSVAAADDDVLGQ